MLIVFSDPYQGQGCQKAFDSFRSSKIIMIKKKHVVSQNSINTEQRSTLSMDLCIPA